MGHRCDLLEFMEETLGQRLARLRKGKQLTQGQLAEIAGIRQMRDLFSQFQAAPVYYHLSNQDREVMKGLFEALLASLPDTT